MAVEYPQAKPAQGPAQCAGGSVERIAHLSVDAFVARYRKPRRPLILTDAMRDWSARDRYTPEFFKREHGDRQIRIRGRDYRLREVIELQRASREYLNKSYCKNSP